MAGFIYLASPYTHPDPAVRQMRFEQACQAAAKLMLAGHAVFSPIAHSHSVETIGIQQVKNGAFWKSQDIPLLRHASKLMVLKLDGWLESSGIGWEMDTAHALMIPVGYMDPEI